MTVAAVVWAIQALTHMRQLKTSSCTRSTPLRLLWAQAPMRSSKLHANRVANRE